MGFIPSAALTAQHLRLIFLQNMKTMPLQSFPERKFYSHWIHYAMAILLICFIVITAYYSFSTGERMSREFAPLIDASMEIKLQATTAHLWFEEVISGDRHENIENAPICVFRMHLCREKSKKGGQKGTKGDISFEILHNTGLSRRNTLTKLHLFPYR